MVDQLQQRNDAAEKPSPADSANNLPRSFVNAQNKVPELQRTYQAAYRAHTRVFQIVSRPSDSGTNRTVTDSDTEPPIELLPDAFQDRHVGCFWRCESHIYLVFRLQVEY